MYPNGRTSVTYCADKHMRDFPCTRFDSHSMALPDSSHLLYLRIKAPIAWKSDNFSDFTPNMQGLSPAVRLLCSRSCLGRWSMSIASSWLLRASAAQRTESMPCLSPSTLLGFRIIIRSTRREIHALSYQMMETHLTQNVTLNTCPCWPLSRRTEAG